MNAFLQKPFTEEMLLTTIQAVIRKNSPVTLTETGSNGRPGSGSTGKVDLHGLYHISGGDDQFVKQMLLSFIVTTEKLLNEMQEAVFARQWELCRPGLMCHSSMPASGSF
jgi:hypothetical protein